MFDNYQVSKSNFFFLKNLENWIFWKKTKILFNGRIYKIKKILSTLTPRINIFQQRYLYYKNFFLKRKKNMWKLFFFKNFGKINYLTLLRPLNLYTAKGFWLKTKPFKKKKKIKNN